MMTGREGMMVIEIWSSDDDAEGERMGKTGKKGPFKKERKSGMKGVKDMEELDCVILDFNPFDTTYLSKKLSLDEPDQDLSVIAERGQVACRDYPHPRHLCVKFPFCRTPHEIYCEQCYCYVCDIKAPCKHWKGSEPEHSHASDNDRKWKNLRREARGRPLSAQDKGAGTDDEGDQGYVRRLGVMDDGDEDFLCPLLALIAGGSREDFLFGGSCGYMAGGIEYDSFYTSDDYPEEDEEDEDDEYEYHSEDHHGEYEYHFEAARPNVKASGSANGETGQTVQIRNVRMTGTVKCFSDQMGYGCITPNSLGGDLFFLRTSVLLDDSSSSLSQGDSVEYEIAPNGAAEAVKVVPHNGCGGDQDRTNYQNSKYDRGGSGRNNRTPRAQGSGRLTGTVKWFSDKKGYGFIISDDGSRDVFIHHTSIQSKSYRGGLSTGQRVEFEMSYGRDGRKQAVNVYDLAVSRQSQSNNDGVGRRDGGQQAVRVVNHGVSRSNDDGVGRRDGRQQAVRIAYHRESRLNDGGDGRRGNDDTRRAQGHREN